MSLYYRPQLFASSGAGRGAGNDGADGGTKFFENLLHAGHFLEGAAAGATGFGYATAADTVTCENILPHPEITGPVASADCMQSVPSEFMGDAIKHIFEAASQMTNPLGFLFAFFELLKGILTAAIEEVIDGLPMCEIYNIAAQASLDWTKRLAS